MPIKSNSSSRLISKFNLRKYQDEGDALVDGSEYLANVKEQVISFYLEPTGEDIFFKAYITAFSDTFTPTYSTTQVFGRTDPIHIYQNTTRAISLGFKLPAASEGEAFENLGKLQTLIQMLYPGYSDLDNALTITEAPLVRLKVMNLLSKQEAFSSEDQASGLDSFFGDLEKDYEVDYYLKYRSTSAPENGTLGVITNLTVNHNLENSDMGVFAKAANTILPKVIDVNLSFTPFHEETIGRGLGFTVANQFINGELVVQDGVDKKVNFPYGVDLGNDSKNNITSAGRSQTKEVALRRESEEARRQASSAQQNLDKETAKYYRIGKRFLNSKEGSRRRERLEEKLDNISLSESQQESLGAVYELESESEQTEQTYQDFVGGA